MVLKRPFGDEESCEHPWKQPRQMECSNQLPYFGEIVSRNEDAQKSHISAHENEGCLNKCQYVDRLVSENVAAHKEFEASAPSSISSFSWVSSSTGGKELKSEAAVRLSFFPGIFEHDHLTRPRTDEEERYSSVFNFLPRRLVSLGPDHQADVPAWGVHSIRNDESVDMATTSVASRESLASSQNIDDDYATKMMGTCVIPMPDSKASDITSDKVGSGRTDCSCQDEGSLRCVRQHIMEAREKLIRTLGQETFVELGFCDMGEEVATKWSEEEENVFHEVVFSSPASLGKNFWDHLSVVFPSRTKKEIVSYYFNVFMLRKRGEQNRVDPLNIDSDNDEWQASEDGDDEHRSEDDEDSVVESQEVNDYPLHIKHFDEDDECGDDESCENNAGNDGFGINGKPDYVSEACNGKSPGDRCSDPAHPRNCEEDHDLQDDSCTSYEYQLSRGDSSYPPTAAANQECRVESDHSKHFQNNYDGLSSMSNLGYDIEPCDAKVWDVGFLSACKTEVDLLPTFNMIEEVFGDEAWTSKGRDGNNMS